VQVDPGRNSNGYEILAAQPVRRTYAFTQAIKIPTNQDELPVEIFKSDTEQIAIDNPTDDPPIQTKQGWQQYAIIGVGGISGLLATIGIAKAVRQIRNRRLVRKFA
jgi:hypothetical protein